MLCIEIKVVYLVREFIGIHISLVAMWILSQVEILNIGSPPPITMLLKHEVPNFSIIHGYSLIEIARMKGMRMWILYITITI